MGKTVKSLLGIEKPEKPKIVLPEQTRPEVIDTAAADAADRERRRRSREGGRASTILTSPLGTSGGTTATKTLLGR